MQVKSNNANFLAAIEVAAKDEILGSIAQHYGISVQQAYDEVTKEDAEHLLDYMVEPMRTATAVLMQAHGFRGGGSRGAVCDEGVAHRAQ